MQEAILAKKTNFTAKKKPTELAKVTREDSQHTIYCDNGEETKDGKISSVSHENTTTSTKKDDQECQPWRPADLNFRKVFEEEKRE